ncbi:phage tail assembly protein [Aliiroseovarius lamellibrachiae]|uniref:phage tail assembly protein n=1 Tax=Aliiroseovarius lamellibrachiae TaxID=1924933 RepID=UPI001BDF78EC|nr:phage tail assembly protein [Aliiroseovarius lamellibrachiae]MBT2131233.1 phage tail assembly protein [Aliiroseovarius lamellibrachiae]
MSKVTKLNATTLSKPLKIDGEKVTEITLRKPSPGELRGLALTDILRMEVDAVTKLLPRVTMPPLSPAQISTELATEDFMDLAGKAVLFFVKKEQMDGEVLELPEPA